MAGNILGSLLLNIVTKSDDSGLRKTDRSLRKIGTTARTVAKNTSLLGSLSKRFMGGFNISSIGNWFSSYLQFEKDLGAMQSRFYAITHSEKESAEEFEYIRKLATDTALDIKKTADSYSIFYSATRNALGKEGARGVYEAWTQVGRVLHLSDYQMERVTYALREMASKGAIYSQDLRMQIGTHVPNAMGLAQKAAEEMGFTGVDWFTKLQEAAKGNTKLTAEFVQKFSKQAQMMYASPEALKKAMQQPDALAKQIANFKYNFGVEFSKAGGSYMVVKILEGTLAFMKTIPFYEIADKLGTMAKTIGFIAKYIPQIVSVLISIAKVVAIGYVLKGFGVVARAFGSIRGMSKAVPFLHKVGYAMIDFGKWGTRIGGFLLGTGGKSLLRGILAPLLGPGSFLMFLPLIYDGIKWLRLKWIDSKKKKMFESGYFLDTDFTNKQVYDIAKKAEGKGFVSQLQLQDFLHSSGFGSISHSFTLQDNGGVKVYVYDENFDAQDFFENMEEYQRGKVERLGNTYFNKPNFIDKVRYGDRVGKQSIWSKI